MRCTLAGLIPWAWPSNGHSNGSRLWACGAGWSQQSRLLVPPKSLLGDLSAVDLPECRPALAFDNVPARAKRWVVSSTVGAPVLCWLLLGRHAERFGPGVRPIVECFAIC